jgi:hypothetical protein
MTRRWACVVILLLLAVPGWAWADEGLETGMAITVAEWAHDVRDEGDYDPNPSGVFPRGSRGYAYLEVEGFAVGGSGDENLVDLRVDIALRSGWGVKLFSQEDLVEYTLPQEAFPPPETVWFYIWVDIPWWAPRATYRAEVTVRDLVSGEAVSLEREITVE